MRLPREAEGEKVKRQQVSIFISGLPCPPTQRYPFHLNAHESTSTNMAARRARRVCNPVLPLRLPHSAGLSALSRN